MLSAATVYIGYFGAVGGIVILAVLTAMLDQPMARINVANAAPRW